MSESEFTDVTTTMTDSCRAHVPGEIDLRRSDVAAESVTVKCGNLEIRPIPRTDGSCPPRYQILMDGKPIAVKEISLRIGVDCFTEARMAWFPDHPEWGGG